MSPGHYWRPNTAWTEDKTFWGAKKVYSGRRANGKFKCFFFSSYEHTRETASEKVKKAEDQNK